MDRMEFRISRLSETKWRRIKSRAKSASNGQLGGLTPLGAAVFVVAAGAALLPPSDSAMPRVQVLGAPIRASHILLMVDVTSSMEDGDKPEKLRQQEAALAAIPVSEKDDITAFGISAQGRDGNLLNRLAPHLKSRGGVDAVYVISDFHPEDQGADCDDGAGIGRFRRLIRQSGVRLYLSSVEMQPSADLQAIAEESGGGVIGQRLQSSSDARREICGSMK